MAPLSAACSPALTARAPAAPGNGITFKTTLKGMSKLNNAALGDLWIPVASLIALGVALGIGCRDLVPPPPASLGRSAPLTLM